MVAISFVPMSQAWREALPHTSSYLILKTVLSRLHYPSLKRETQVWVAHMTCLRLHGG